MPKKTKKKRREENSAAQFVYYLVCLAYDKSADLVKKISAVIVVDLELEILGKIQAENAHNRLRVDSVASAYDIHVIIAAGNDINEILNIADFCDLDFCCCHSLHPLNVGAVMPLCF